MVQIITVLNHKGGVGKTTSSVNIGAGLSLKGKKVLLIDLDPQANLTLHFSLPIDKTPNVYEALRGESLLPITEVKDNLDVVTSSLDRSCSFTFETPSYKTNATINIIHYLIIFY